MLKRTEITGLFSSVKSVIAHQQQIDRLKGEQFNIFSVLRMERSENKTHSVFLAELLSPKGIHLKGTIFLDLFLKTLKLENYLSAESSVVDTEYHIGPIDNMQKSGGRIDILIRDGNNKMVSIENKIDACDQSFQIERYYNFNMGSNKVYYLTLDGRSPSVESKGNLVVDQDFHLLSYRDNIIDWLGLCQKEAADAPMLRETIKQYIILLKKMTNLADKQHENELIDIVIDNYEAAAFVSTAIVKARQRIGDEIRHAVLNGLRSFPLPIGLVANIGSDISKRYAQIWVWHEAHKNVQLYFGIESFNGTGNSGGDLFVGVFNSTATANDYTREFSDTRSQYWFDVVFLEFEGARINFSNDNLILNIKNTKGYRERLVQQIVTQVSGYFASREQKILHYIANPNK